MPRYLFMHCGGPPMVTPDLPDPPAVEAWAMRRFGYDDGIQWVDVDYRDISPGGITDLSVLGTSGDPQLDWPTVRAANDEDWYAGPVTVCGTEIEDARPRLTALLEVLRAAVRPLGGPPDVMRWAEAIDSAINLMAELIDPKTFQ